MTKLSYEAGKLKCFKDALPLLGPTAPPHLHGRSPADPGESCRVEPLSLQSPGGSQLPAWAAASGYPDKGTGGAVGSDLLGDSLLGSQPRPRLMAGWSSLELTVMAASHPSLPSAVRPRCPGAGPPAALTPSPEKVGRLKLRSTTPWALMSGK